MASTNESIDWQVCELCDLVPEDWIEHQDELPDHDEWHECHDLVTGGFVETTTADVGVEDIQCIA